MRIIHLKLLTTHKQARRLGLANCAPFSRCQIPCSVCFRLDFVLVCFIHQERLFIISLCFISLLPLLGITHICLFHNSDGHIVK